MRTAELVTMRSRTQTPGLGLLWIVSMLLLVSLWRRDRASPAVRRLDAPQAACAWPIEWVGRGLVCISAQDAAERRLQAGQRWSPNGSLAPQSEPQRSSALRSLLAGVPVDLQEATEADLLALPDLGPARARNLIAARQAFRLRCLPDLARVLGLGSLRMRRLLPFVKPLPQDCPPAHPTQ